MYFYLYVFNTYNFCNFFNTFLTELLNTYLIAAREKFKILKNGSNYQGAWPPLHYNMEKKEIQIKCRYISASNNFSQSIERNMFRAIKMEQTELRRVIKGLPYLFDSPFCMLHALLCRHTLFYLLTKASHKPYVLLRGLFAVNKYFAIFIS